nr:hypothetical protein [Tanacetum cinerariifolium]
MANFTFYQERILIMREEDDVVLIDYSIVELVKNRKVSVSLKVAGLRKQTTSEPLGRETHQKTRKVSRQASKAAGKPSDALDVDSDPDIL